MGTVWIVVICDPALLSALSFVARITCRHTRCRFSSVCKRARIVSAAQDWESTQPSNVKQQHQLHCALSTLLAQRSDNNNKLGATSYGCQALRPHTEVQCRSCSERRGFNARLDTVSASLASGKSSETFDKSGHGLAWSDTMGSEMRVMDARGEAGNCGRVRP